MTEQLPAKTSVTWANWLNFLRAYKVVTERIEQKLAAEGQPTLVEYSLLFVLYRQAEHRLRQVDVANGVLISKSRVTRLMNTLVRKGYVRREKGSSDRRVTYTVLTERGRQAYEQATPTFAEAFEQHFASLIAERDRGLIYAALAPIHLQGTTMSGRQLAAAPNAPLPEA